MAGALWHEEIIVRTISRGRRILTNRTSGEAGEGTLIRKGRIFIGDRRQTSRLEENRGDSRESSAGRCAGKRNCNRANLMSLQDNYFCRVFSIEMESFAKHPAEEAGVQDRSASHSISVIWRLFGRTHLVPTWFPFVFHLASHSYFQSSTFSCDQIIKS